MLGTRTSGPSHAWAGSEAGWPRRTVRSLSEAANAVLGPTELGTQRQDIVRRAIVAAAIIAVLPIQELRIPGWPAILGGCIAALLYDLPMAYLVFVRSHALAQRVLGLALDALVLMGTSFYVFSEMGAVNSTSDIWLVFVVYIVIGGFTLAPIGSLLYTSLWTGWFALGTHIFFPHPSHFTDQLPLRMVFLGLCGLVSLGMASELQKRRSKLQQQHRQTMAMLAKLVEARDTDAGAHLHRIQHFSRALALHIGLSRQQAQEIADASMMHDVGKANVPDAILKKPGALSPEEWQSMRLHTVWGDRLLTESQSFELARQVARSHHEHWDGRGYPDGLAARQILLAARIVSVADVYDALISERPYKKAWAPDAAIRELQRIGGSQLDPMLVEAFVELWEDGVIQRIDHTLQEAEASAPLLEINAA